MGSPGRIWKKRQLLDVLWLDSREKTDPRVVDKSVERLRKALGFTK